jgi:hypothetical protein
MNTYFSKEYDVPETGSVPVLIWGGGKYLLCGFRWKSLIAGTELTEVSSTNSVPETLCSVECRTIDEVQESCNRDCYLKSPWLSFLTNICLNMYYSVHTLTYKNRLGPPSKKWLFRQTDVISDNVRGALTSCDPAVGRRWSMPSPWQRGSQSTHSG